MKTAFIVTVLTTAVILSGCGTGEMANWEYKVISIAEMTMGTSLPDSPPPVASPAPSEQKPNFFTLGAKLQASIDAVYAPAIEKKINALSKDGWQVVAGTDRFLIFRRQI